MTVTRLALVPTNPDRVTEPDLIARVVAGDRLAARALYDAHVGRVHRLAFRLTGDSQLAHEVTQDTFVKALSNLGQFRGDAQFTTWLHRISDSAGQVRGLIEGIAGRMREVSAGTEDYAAAAEEIAAAAEQLNASTEEISSSATHLADAAERLTGAVGGFKLQ